MPAKPAPPNAAPVRDAGGVHTVIGVPTSTTAFVGSAGRGPVGEPIPVFSLTDYERTFGGLSLSSPLGYAVRDYFLNGGGQALIVRLVSQNPADPAASASLTVGGLTLTASSPGAWSRNLRASVEVLNGDAPPGPTFTLTVRDTGPGGVTEVFRGLTVVGGAERVDKVVNGVSRLVTVAFDPADPPAVTSAVDIAPDAARRGADGATLTPADYVGDGIGTGLFALEKADLFNLLCLPPPNFGDGVAPDTPAQVYQIALLYCVKRRALLLVDPPAGWASAGDILAGGASKLAALGLSGPDAHNAALYFPRVLEADPQRGGQVGAFVPSGVVAGVISRTDAQHGVWKAPAGSGASVNGTTGLEHAVTDGENGSLNALGVNCLRTFPAFGSVVWGARTLGGADRMADDYKYVPVRRLALFIEESLDRGTRWAAFEPNGEPLWAQIRLDVGAFLHGLFRQGAFQGTTPAQAFFVKCDQETTTQSDISGGIVNIAVGFAPLRPAEFVILSLQQRAE